VDLRREMYITFRIDGKRHNVVREKLHITTHIATLHGFVSIAATTVQFEVI
jgi:hypothetical protein